MPESVAQHPEIQVARRRGFLLLASLAAANILLWGLTLLAFRRFPLLLGTSTLAYTLGLRHALDADHISAIDNVTRKLMHQGRRPISVGFYFSLGHSTVVIIMSLLLALGAAHLQKNFPEMIRVGGFIGTSVSAAFLLLIAAINVFVLYQVFRAFRAAKRGQPAPSAPDNLLNQMGLLGRLFRPLLKVADQTWKMYFVGFLFGLGFDTATEVAVLGISAVSATQGLPIWSILLFPALFTAGMCFVDTADGLLMLAVYGWAYVHPTRKLYYNLTITTLSVLVAVFVAGIECLGLLANYLGLRDPIGHVANHFGTIGVLIVTLCILCWIASLLAHRRTTESS